MKPSFLSSLLAAIKRLTGMQQSAPPSSSADEPAQSPSPRTLRTHLLTFKDAAQRIAREEDFRTILRTFGPFGEFQERCYAEDGGGSTYIGDGVVNEVLWNTCFASFCCTLDLQSLDGERDRQTIPGDYLCSLGLRFERGAVTLADLAEVFGDFRWDVPEGMSPQDIFQPVAYFSSQSVAPGSWASIAVAIAEYDAADPLQSSTYLLQLGYTDDRDDTSFPL